MNTEDPSWVRELLAQTDSGDWTGIGPYTMIYRFDGRTIAKRFPTPGLRNAYLQNLGDQAEVLLYHDPRSGVPQPR
jgi:hypothetical protein